MKRITDRLEPYLRPVWKLSLKVRAIYHASPVLLRIEIDSKRIAKSLYTAHPDGIAPILYQVSGEQEDASFIAVEIKRLVAQMGGAFKWGDFAILRESMSLQSRGSCNPADIVQ